MTRRLVRNERGATIVEFAIVSPVLIMAVMGLFDLTYSLYVNAGLQGAVQKAARDATIEDANSKTAQAKLDQKVTQVVKSIIPGADPKFLRRYYKTYAAASAKQAEPWTDTNGNKTCDAGEPFTDTNNNHVWDKDGADDSGGAKDRIVYTVNVQYTRPFPIAAFIGQSPIAIATATTVLENQPYADQTQYGTAGSGNCN